MIDASVEAECKECRELTKDLLVNTSYTLIVILIMVIAAILVGTPRAHGSEALLDAIAVLESQPGRSDGGKAHGVFQMHAAAFRDVQKHKPAWAHHDISILRKPVWARRYAAAYIETISRLLASHGHETSPANLWVAWNLGPTRFLRARGFSFDELPKRTAEGINYINARLKTQQYGGN